MSITNSIIQILGGLAFFLLGMTTMSDALQKVAGDRMRALLRAMTGRPWTGLLTGFLVTSIIQSSSATTVMVVSFVHANLMNLEQAIGVILGANIGTTVTAWIVSLLGFKFKIKAFALPAIILGFAGKFTKREKLVNWGEVLLGFGLLFFGLMMMEEALKTKENLEMAKHWMSFLHAGGMLSRLYTIAVGTAITMIIQSSSATMALTIVLAHQGVIDYQTALALVMGENIGTTITANIAAIAANRTAKQAARAHMLFNVFGVTVVFFTWPLWMALVDWLVPGPIADPHEVPLHMSAFHTTFNVLNALLFLPFVKYLAKAARWLVPEPSARAKRETSELKYIDYGLVPTPELALLAARKDMQYIGDTVLEMLDRLEELIKDPLGDKGKVVTELMRLEEKVDRMAEEMVDYLTHLSQAPLSYEESRELAGLLHTVTDYERMGDHCEQITKLLRRRHEYQYPFVEDAQKEMLELSDKVRTFVKFVRNHLPEHQDIMDEAYAMEEEINRMSKRLRKSNIERMSNDPRLVEGGLIHINMITSYEKIGDHNVNIAEEISGLR